MARIQYRYRRRFETPSDPATAEGVVYILPLQFPVLKRVLLRSRHSLRMVTAMSPSYFAKSNHFTALASAAGEAADIGNHEAWENEGGSLLRHRADFHVYLEESVRVNALLVSGGDWRWQYRTAAGKLVAGGSGFHSKADCLEVVELLRRGAAGAQIRISPREA